MGAPKSGNTPVDVNDFETGVDTIRLDGSFMPQLGASGRFTADDPGETSPGTWERRPARMAAAARRSSIRLLVQEPMKTRSIRIWSSRWPGRSAM